VEQANRAKATPHRRPRDRAHEPSGLVEIEEVLKKFGKKLES
jgi:hypothetical protein